MAYKVDTKKQDGNLATGLVQVKEIEKMPFFAAKAAIAAVNKTTSTNECDNNPTNEFNKGYFGK